MLKPHSFRIFLKLGLGVKNRDFWDGVVKLIFLHHLPNVPINSKVIPIDLDWWTGLKLDQFISICLFQSRPNKRGCFHSLVGVVNSKKFCCWKRFSTDFGPKVTDLLSIFRLTSIWSSTAASKSEAPKSTLLYKSCSNEKILADLLYQF